MVEDCSSRKRQDDATSFTYQRSGHLHCTPYELHGALSDVQNRFTTLPTAQRHSTAACADDRHSGHVTPNEHTRWLHSLKVSQHQTGRRQSRKGGKRVHTHTHTCRPPSKYLGPHPEAAKLLQVSVCTVVDRVPS